MDEVHENHREDVRKSVEMIEGGRKTGKATGPSGVQHGGWWLTLPGHVGPERKETRRMRYADCENDERRNKKTERYETREPGERS